MTVWNLEQRATFDKVKERAAKVAVDVVERCWPYSQPWPRRNMPQDLNEWAEGLTDLFLRRDTTELPAWVLREGNDMLRRSYEQVLRNVFYEAVLGSLKYMIEHRIRASGRLPAGLPRPQANPAEPTRRKRVRERVNRVSPDARSRVISAEDDGWRIPPLHDAYPDIPDECEDE